MFGLTFGGSKTETKSREELIREAFGDLMGPVGMHVFEIFKQNGFVKTEILDYINKLENEGTVKKDHADSFRQKINDILQ